MGRAIRVQGSDNQNEVYGHILNYAAVLPMREMGVMLVSDMHRAIGDDIFAVPEFSNWAEAIGDLMLY